MESTLCECACSDFRPEGFSALENIQKIKSLISLYAEEFKTAVIGNYWRARILAPYSGRLLTKSTDKLVALAAVASRLHSEFGLTYLAGLWKDDLIKELLWWVRPPLRNEKHDPIYQERFFAPTWSWISVDAPMSWHPFTNNYPAEEPLAQVLEAYTRPSTVNPFGPVSCGEIKLSASVRPVTAEYDDKMDWWAIPVAQISESLSNEVAIVTFDTSLRVTIEHDELTQEEHPTVRRLRHGEDEEEEENKKSKLPVIAVPLIMMGYSDGLRECMHGLILRESVTRIGCFERLGNFLMSCSAKHVGLRTMARQEIVLV